jgi:hypothetical protein
MHALNSILFSYTPNPTYILSLSVTKLTKFGQKDLLCLYSSVFNCSSLLNISPLSEYPRLGNLSYLTKLNTTSGITHFTSPSPSPSHLSSSFSSFFAISSCQIFAWLTSSYICLSTTSTQFHLVSPPLGTRPHAL